MNMQRRLLLGTLLAWVVVLSATASAHAGPTSAGLQSRNAHEGEDQGEPNNIVEASNRTANRLVVVGRAQINSITGPVVEPVNFALSHASCTDCQVIAVALQIDVVGENLTTVAPQNIAVALAEQCIRCQAVAWATQYVMSAEDPTDVPGGFESTVDKLNREFEEIAEDEHMTVAEALHRLDLVIARFDDLANTLDARLIERAQRHGENRGRTHKNEHREERRGSDDGRG